MKKNEVLNKIEEMKYLATDMRYDGWHQNFYREKLIEIKEYINSLPEEIFKLHKDR